MIYYLILKLRDALYRSGIKKSVKAAVPTVCVGNVTVGGTGKTPHTEMILRELLSSNEWGAGNIAVLSRGYKRRSRGFLEVQKDFPASQCGDEPLQIKRKFPQVTVAVDKNRVHGCSRLAADMIVLDDAFQYRSLSADLNVVLADWNRPIDRDSLLPFGRLRDLKSRMRDADVIIVTKCPACLENDEKEAYARTLGFVSYDGDACTGTTSRGQSQTVLFSTTRYSRCVGVFDTADPRYVYSKKAVLFTGIANDLPLKQHLSDSYKIVDSFSFPDHHAYSASDFRDVAAAVRRNPTAVVLTTEKDAQRVLDVHSVPQMLRERMFYVPIEAEFLTAREREVFLGRLLKTGSKR